MTRRRRRVGIAPIACAAGIACVGCFSPRPPMSAASLAAEGDADAAPFVIAPVAHVPTTASTGPSLQGFVAADAASFQFAANQGVAGVTAQITINSTANACADANANVLHVGESQLVILLKDVPDPQMAAGTYVYPADADAPYEIIGATFAAVEAPCTYDAIDALVAGSVTLAEVQAGGPLAGSYSLQYAAGTLSGSFSAPSCAALQVTPSTPPTCAAATGG